MAWKQPLGRGNFEKRPKPKPRTLAGLMVKIVLSAHRNIVRSIHVATWHEDDCRHLWPTRDRSDARGTSWAPHLRVRGHSRGAGGSTGRPPAVPGRGDPVAGAYCATTRLAQGLVAILGKP